MIRSLCVCHTEYLPLHGQWLLPSLFLSLVHTVTQSRSSHVVLAGNCRGTCICCRMWIGRRAGRAVTRSCRDGTCGLAWAGAWLEGLNWKAGHGDSSVGAGHLRGGSRCVCVSLCVHAHCKPVALEESNYEHHIKLIYTRISAGQEAWLAGLTYLGQEGISRGLLRWVSGRLAILTNNPAVSPSKACTPLSAAGGKHKSDFRSIFWPLAFSLSGTLRTNLSK